MPALNFFEQVFNGGVDVSKLKTKKKHISNVAWPVLKAEVRRRFFETHDWSGMTSKHFVAMYSVMHQTVYQVDPVELDDRQRAASVCIARTMLHRQFDGDTRKMVDFFVWVWRREYLREKWREANGVAGYRITINHQFSNRLLTEWRVNGHRRLEELASDFKKTKR